MTSPEQPARSRLKNRRDVILRTAAELFGERGYHAVGIDDIGEAVGITGPAVYRHFGTKEDIVMAAIERSLDRMLDAVNAIAASADPAVDLRRIVDAVVAAELDDWDFAVVRQREYRGLPRDRLDEVQPRRRAIIGAISSAVRATRPGLSGADLRVRLDAQHGVLTGVLLHGTKSHRRRYQALVSEMATRMLDLDGVPAVAPRRPHTVAVADLSRASRREVVLAAAVELFAERGYRAVGIDDAGLHGGITGPTVYRHFDSKEALLTEAIRRMGHTLSVAVSSVLNRAATPADLIAALTRRLVELAHVCPDLLLVYFHESHHLGTAEQHWYEQNRATLFEEWELLLRRARPELSDASAHDVVAGTIGSSLGVAAARDLRSFDVRDAMYTLLVDAQLGAGRAGATPAPVAAVAAADHVPAT